ncbi:hypothetical protein Tco_1119737, partial [Tanacetum coccineum]
KDSNEAAFSVAEAEKIYAHESLTFNNTVACEMIWFFLTDARLRSRLPRVCWIKQREIIDNGKSVKRPLGGHFKLSLKDCPVRDCDVERMSQVPYANAAGSLMYLMVCTKPDIGNNTLAAIRAQEKKKNRGRRVV